MHRSFLRALGAVCTGFIWTATIAHAQPTQLKLATFGPPQSYFYVEVVIPWMEAVNRDSAGTVDIKHFGSSVLGNAGNMYDAVLSGAADIGWALQGAVPGKFVKSSIIELPFGYEKGEIGAVAFWRLYAKGLISSDYDEVKLFGVTAWPAAGIQTKSKRVQSLEDLKGIKLRVSGRLQADTVRTLGATPVNIAVDEIYQAIDKGVIDGAWASFTATKQFRLDEIVKHYLEVPLNGAGAMLIMKRGTFEKLPAAAKDAFEKHSGEALSRALGRSNDGEVVRVMAMLNSAAQQGKLEAPHALPPAELARWMKAAEPVADAWARSVPNGPAIIEAFRGETAALEAAAK
jgi:TRAP-type C4-dicarboxylate transport system substrate-binding protein